MSTRISRIGPQETIGLGSHEGTEAPKNAGETRASGPEAQSVVQAVYERVDIDRYAVVLGSTVGYVEVVPPLFICYAGHPYPRATEIAQVHDFDAAVRIVQDHAAQAPSSRAAG